MSVKSKAKKVGGFLVKYVLTLGIGALVDRYVKGAAAEAIKNGVKVAVGEVVDAKKLSPATQEEINRAIREKVVPRLREHAESSRLDMQAQIARGLRRGRK